MKLSCSRPELRRALRIVGGVVDPRSIRPILQDIHLCMVPEGLELSATDLEVGIKFVVRDVETEEEGGIVVPGDPLGGIVGESRDERLVLHVEDTSLVVEGRASKFRLIGVSEEEFPKIPGFPEEKSLEVEGAILGEMIDKTIFAVATEKQRYALDGVLLNARQDSTHLEMVGTDGRRMALIRRKANGPSPFTALMIIPVKALRQAQKMITDEEVVRIFAQQRQILLRSEAGVLVAQLVEGRFPKYREVIPTDCDKHLEVAADEFANGLRQAAVVAARDARAVCLRVSGKSMVIESSNPEAGQAHVELAVKYEGAPIEIRFNPDFLLDGIKAMGDETIRLEMKDPDSTAIMRGSGDYMYLVMPVTQEQV